jgi:hypothetical protein
VQKPRDEEPQLEEIEPLPTITETADARGLDNEHSDNFRFLLYDAAFGATFASQLRLFLAVTEVVAELNAGIFRKCGDGPASKPECKPWKLVLPPWCSAVHWYSDTSGMNWRKLFSYAGASGKEVPMIEYSDVKGTLGVVDLMVLPAVAPHGAEGKAGSRTGPFAGFVESLERCQEASGGQQVVPQFSSAAKGRRHVVYSGYCDGDCPIADVRCGYLREASRAAVVEMVRAVPPKKRSVLLKHLDAVGLPYTGQFQAALVPAPGLATVARGFVERALGELPFLGVHLRRNEFVRQHPDKTPSASAAAARLNYLLKKKGLEQVFVATDALPDFREALRRLVRAPLYYFAPDDGAPELNHKGKEEVVCLYTLAKAKHFIGTAEASFSAVVRGERTRLGLTSKASEVFCSGLSDATAERRCNE